LGFDVPRSPEFSNDGAEEESMAIATRIKPYTFEEFCELVKDGQKADLIDGVIYMASPDNTDANDLFMWLGGLVYDFVEIKELGKVFGSRVAYRLDETNGPEPDIGFVNKKRSSAVKQGRVEGPPDLAVEIVSPDSVDRDYKKKRLLYEKSGVREYWIVDEIKQTVTLLRLTGKRKYREVRPRKGELHSQVLPGFRIRPEWLWQNPRPKKMVVLNWLLAQEG
jgi:Uma2 family endonuclease